MPESSDARRDGIVNLIGDEQAFCTDGADERSQPSLTRQKMLQTGQVLLRRLSVDFALDLPFKDSQRGG
jgi:hypothetical protein